MSGQVSEQAGGTRRARTAVWVSVVAIAVVTCAVIAGAVLLLRPGASGADGSSADGAGTGGNGAVVAGEGGVDKHDALPGAELRPDCPAGGVAGVDLPCLGGADKALAAEPAVTVVNVWAWWCGPCRDELPVVEAFAAAHPEYQVVGVHADQNAANGIALLNDLRVGVPSYQDDRNRFAGALGLPAVVPVTVVLRGGEQVGVIARAFTSLPELEQAVEEVLARG